jgi:multidrug efflux pump subunit AcrA (membrane-fusion protein)
MTRTPTILLFILLAASPGCTERAPIVAAPPTEPTLGTNRVSIPSAVRKNLGITFAKVERRRIKETLRAPGRFEYLPTAQRAYRTMLPGRVEVLVEQFAPVQAGTLLYRIDSPEWRATQKSISTANLLVAQLKAEQATFDPLLTAHQRHEQSLHNSIEVWSARVERLSALRDAGGGRMSEFTAAQAALSTANADLASVQEKTAELDASRVKTIAALAAAEANLALTLDAAASLAGVSREVLLATWRDINTIEVTALAPGIVESIDLTNGVWAAERTNVLTVVQPERLRFHASGLQSDLGVLRDGLEAMIVAPSPTEAGHAIPLSSVMRGTLTLGLSGDPNDRTIDMYVTPDHLEAWARPGVTAHLEIVTDATATPELAIPLAAVQRDGLNAVLFRRDPDNPNEAIRMHADLGVDDGRWVAILSGLLDGDEVILDGGFQLMLATSTAGATQEGGHFHADGTFHEGAH